MSAGTGPISNRMIKHRSVHPDQMGLDVENAFAGALAVGTLVYVSGVNTTTGKPKVSKADADAAAPANLAQYVVVEAIPQSGYGRVARAATLINLDTSGYSAAGDPVYLSATAGASTPTAPTGTRQIVGYVKTKHATTGEIAFDLQNAAQVASVPPVLTVSRATVANGGTISDSQMGGGILYQDASGGNVTMTTRTGTQIDAAFPFLAVDNAIPIYHCSNHASNTSAISGGSGVTIIGSAAVTQTGGQYLLVKTGTATYDLCRVG